MFSFKGFITTEKNTHLEHLEDDIINRGSDGGRNAVNFLKSVRNMLAGSASGRVNMSVKWDGAPAIVAGKNPENGKFFFAQNQFSIKHLKSITHLAILQEIIVVLLPLNYLYV